jgi:hypothetical protein
MTVSTITMKDRIDQVRRGIKKEGSVEKEKVKERKKRGVWRVGECETV